MVIRAFRSEDESPVIELWRRCNLVSPGNDPSEDIRLKQEVQPELFLVGTVEDQLVASIMAGYDGHRGWLYSVAVDPAWQKRGFGSQIVAEAETKLRALGCRKVNLQVRSTNRTVIAFYESLGFEVEERISLGKRL